MFKSRYVAVGATLAALAGGATGLAATAATAATAHPASVAAIKVASAKVAVGSTNKAYKVLVNLGRLVYMLTGDSPSHPKCNSSNCHSFWPPVTTTATKLAAAPAIAGKVGVWHHNGINQVTLNGHPLYTFAQDSAARPW